MSTIIPERLLLLLAVAGGMLLIVAALARITGRSGHTRPRRVAVRVIVVSIIVMGCILACSLIGGMYLPGVN
jgi:hypothetical protein